MPMAGLTGSDLMTASGFRTVKDPYTGEEWAAIPAIKPDWAIIHVHAADAAGNCRIRGPRYDDLLKAKAARHILVTCEQLVTGDELAAQPELTDLPGFLVDAVVLLPGGAAPHSCPGLYDADHSFFSDYLAAAGNAEAYDRFVAERVLARGGGGR